MTPGAAGSAAELKSAMSPAASAVLFIFSGGSLDQNAAKRAQQSAVTVLRPQIAPLWFRPQTLQAIFIRKDLKNDASLDGNSNKRVQWAEGIQSEHDTNLFG